MVNPIRNEQPAAMGTLASTSASTMVNPSRDEEWDRNFRLVKKFYDEHGHLTMPRNNSNFLRLTQWLTYQRHQAKRLKKHQLRLLESIRYNNVPIFREEDEKEWLFKFEEWKNNSSEDRSVKSKNAHSIACWLSRQKKLDCLGLLKSERRDLLISSGALTRRKHRKQGESSMQREQWLSQFAQLEKYRQVHGHCNVPKRWKNNLSLGIWVFNQRRKYKDMQDGIAEMPKYRIDKLEEIGFQWSLRNIRRVAAAEKSHRL